VKLIMKKLPSLPVQIFELNQNPNFEDEENRNNTGNWHTIFIV